MSKRTSDNGCTRGRSIHLSIYETCVAYLATHRTEEAGIVFGTTGCEVADDVALTVEVNPVAIAVLAGVELLPVVALHINICAKHEINHHILLEDVVHMVELLWTKNNIRILLAAVACLIGIHHVAPCCLQTSDEGFQVLVLEAASGKHLLTFCQSVLCFLGSIAASLSNSNLVLQGCHLDNEIGIGINTGLNAINGSVYLQQLIVARQDIFRCLSRCLIVSHRFVEPIIVGLAAICEAVRHFIVAVQDRSQSCRVGICGLAAIDDVDVTDIEALSL